jgi:hypothetical protein
MQYELQELSADDAKKNAVRLRRAGWRQYGMRKDRDAVFVKLRREVKK